MEMRLVRACESGWVRAGGPAGGPCMCEHVPPSTFEILGRWVRFRRLVPGLGR